MSIYDVTSWFEVEAATRVPVLVRKFSLGTSDYSGSVTKWPRIRRRYNDIRPGSITINLSNEDQTFNFFQTNPEEIVNTGTVQIGFTHPTSGDELITPFEGAIERVKYTKGQCLITLTDKFKQLSERIVGDNENPVDFTTSDYLPSDIAWSLVTSHGGFSALKSTANPDVDYDAFEAWSSVFSEDNVLSRGWFDGVKVTEALRKLGRITDSAIYIKNNKVSFHRFSITDSYSTQATYETLTQVDLEIDDAEIINQQYMLAAYNVNSEVFDITCFDADTPSVNSFSLRTEYEEDTNFWYVNSVSALNYVQRRLFTRAYPYNRYSIRTGLAMLPRQIGENVLLTDSFFNEIATGFRIMEQEVDLNTGLISQVLDRSMLLNAFRLDYSALDSSDVLG